MIFRKCNKKDKSHNGYRNKHLKLILPVISDNEIGAMGDPVLNCDQASCC